MKAISTEKVPINGQMKKNLPEIMSIILCKASASSLGKTDEFTKETTRMTKKVGMEFSNGLMAGNMRVIGKMVNKAEKASTSTLMERREKDFGKMAKGKDGKNEILDLHSIK